MESGRLIYNNDVSVSFDGIIYTKDDYKRMYHSDDIPKFEEEAFEQERVLSNLFFSRNRNFM